MTAYRIDLGFYLFDANAVPEAAQAMPVPPALRPQAARLERGLPLVERPWTALAGASAAPCND